MSDRLAGLVLLVIAGAYLWAAGGYAASFGDPLGPAAFPKLVGTCALGLAVLLVVWPGPEPDWARGPRLARQAATLAVLIGYALLLEPLGFIAATFLALTALAVLMRATVPKAVASGLVIAPALFLLFDRVLDLPLPLLGTWIG